MGTGQMMGEEDLLNERTHTTTVICKSAASEVYCIKVEDFIKKFKTNNFECWKVIVMMAAAKERAIQ